MANHLTIGVYSNGDWKYNVVRDEDLESHIDYNKTFRFGRILYVDGKRVYDGTSHPHELEHYDAIEKRVREEILKDINMNKPTIPYR